MKLLHKVETKIVEFLKSFKDIDFPDQFEDTQAPDHAENVENAEYALKSTEKPKAIAFVDFEHWYYSYQQFYHISPKISEWRKQLDEKYQLEDVMVFANFSDGEIREDLAKIRTVTNSIIETQQVTKIEKEMTDFIMLDYIYQHVNEHPDTEVYILFTGDAHFQSAVKYLMQKKNKTVVVYGVKNAFSSQLKAVASEAVELPASDDVIRSLYPLIVENMAYVSSRFDIVPTFSATARKISEQHSISEEIVKAALNDMKRKGYLYTRKQRVSFNQFVPVLAANWDILAQAGLWSFG